MSTRRLREGLCWLLGAAVAAHGVTTALRLRRAKAEQRAALGPDFVDPVTRVEAKLGPIPARVAERPSVRYVSGPPGYDLFEVQYALVPTVLKWRNPPGPAIPEPADRTFVVANFQTAAALDVYLRDQPHELRWRRGGVALLRMR